MVMDGGADHHYLAWCRSVGPCLRRVRDCGADLPFPHRVLIPSSTGLAAATMGIMVAALSQFTGVDVAIMVTICMALGLAKMISPTSIVVMTCTSAAHMSYGDWVARCTHRGASCSWCCVLCSPWP